MDAVGLSWNRFLPWLREMDDLRRSGLFLICRVDRLMAKRHPTHLSACNSFSPSHIFAFHSTTSESRSYSGKAAGILLEIRLDTKLNLSWTIGGVGDRSETRIVYRRIGSSKDGVVERVLGFDPEFKLCCLA